MNRVLPLGALLCLSPLLAQAQQVDILAPRPVALEVPTADSLRIPGFSICYNQRIVTVTDFTPPPFTNIQPVLSRIAGVQVTPYSGAPGAWAVVRVRGVINLAGHNQPLYVVDGVPVYNTDVKPETFSAATIVSGPQSTQPMPRTPGANPLMDLPVEDVASVEVLKGAAATALYGMQGANGVVRITTKRGGDGRDAPQSLRVRYAGYGGLQQVRQRYDLLNARQFAEVANAAWANDGGFGGVPPYDEATIQRRGEVDWQDRLLRVAGVQSHNLSLDGHRGGTRYFVAADYLRQAGVVINSRLSRANLRLNLEQQLGRKLTLDLKAAGTQIDQRQPGADNDAADVLRTALLEEPLGVESRSGLPVLTPEQQATEFFHAPRTRRLLTQLGATYQLVPDLTLYTRGGYERVYVRESYHTPDQAYPDGSLMRRTELSKTFAESWVAEAGARYHHAFAAGHALSASLTYLRQESQNRLSRDQKTFLVNGGNFGYSSSYAKFRQKSVPIHSPTAVVNFTYGGRYEAQASMRADVAKGNEWKAYWFPGAQLSWHLAKESFLLDNSVLSTLTLYAGTGLTSSYFTPDRTRQFDGGLLVGVLQNRFTLSLDAYQRRTEHAQGLLAVTVPSGSGSGIRYYTPDVTLRNRGLELTLTGSWQTGALTGISALAASLNQNEVTSRSYQDQVLTYLGLEKGHPVSRFLAYNQEGINPAGAPAAGRIRYRDVNNDGLRNRDDAYYQGTGLPRYALSFTQQLRRGPFELNAQLDGLFGYQIFNATLQTLDLPNGYTNSSRLALNYWTPTRTDTYIPAPTERNFSAPVPTDRDLSSGNHLRLTQFTLGYDVINTATRQLNVWIGGQNLLVTGPYRGYDPNVSGGGASPIAAGQDASVYPVARVWQVGVRGRF